MPHIRASGRNTDIARRVHPQEDNDSGFGQTPRGNLARELSKAFICVKKKIFSCGVRATQNCSSIARHENTSQDIDAQLSKIEYNGEKKYRSETSNAKL